MPLPPLAALRAFEATVRLGAVTRAAEELHVTHGAVSQQLRLLEAWYGHRLFERKGRGIVATAAAEAFAAELGDGLARIALACERHRADSDRPHLTVASIVSFAARRLVPILPDFLEANPGLRLRLVYALGGDDLRSPDIDLVIRHVDGTPDRPARFLLPGLARPVCSPRYLERHGPLRAPVELLSASLLHDDSDIAWRGWLRSAGLEPGQRLPGPVFQDFGLLSTAAVAGHGVALCPVELVREELARGDLVTLFAQAAHVERGYWLLHRDPPSRPAAAFCDWLAAQVAAAGPLVPAPAARESGNPQPS